MRIIPLLMSVVLLCSCSYIPKLDKVLPDKRNDYKKSQSLPDLEIPPDLTGDSINDSMAIPNERAATLSGYQRNRTEEKPVSPVVSANGEQWLAVKGTNEQVWPKLRQYFSENGYSVELDDVDLGVMETGWSESVTESGFVYRDKFKVFSEPGGETGNIVLYLSGNRQEQITSADGDSEWIDQGKSVEKEKQLAGALNLLLNAGSALAATSSTSQSAGSVRPKAKVVSTDDGKLFLTIPEEFTRAWHRTEESLHRAGFTIDNKDLSKGIFFITYYDAVKEKKGWLSKMAFWRGDDTKGIPYRISLTGVGEKTEIIVLNEDGEWESDANSDGILSIIQEQYNR